MNSPYRIIVDSETGERYAPVDDVLRFFREHKPGITRIEVIRRLAAVGWTFQYIEARNPDPPHDVIGIDFFHVPVGWEQVSWAES